MNFMRLPIFPFIIIALLSGCASNDKDFSDNADQEYAHAKQLIEEGEFGMATKRLEKFDSKYPYSKLAIQSELMRIFSAYKGNEFVLSETMSLRFIDRHPTHKNVDYAKYMLAMSYYQQRTSAEKDISMYKSSISAFERLIKEHPESAYAESAQNRLQSLYNILAEHELIIGKYYFDHDRFVASANRFQELVRLYQTTSSIEEALYYLAASYAKMGLKRDARQTAMILKHNHPNSPWSSKSEQYL
ncbi:outer membrane protein assembly factor BamD [Mariprofundus sp. EBB-1]|uniref:outer membrane protein assembly factor BamD n=1 Tax=Mariprofundus sp. EBB-1 TaxID=2650971 RepID=UPI000EF26111|nr:outer membrane protein assembly factor BamD [Mariprofundus sp. EBB-1]RLL51019.1 outer membrane protein assembly factor BamD [Mariprofundus sp. EBB-1]